MDMLFKHTLLLLLTSTVGVAFAVRLGAPSILGYLIAGVALGPSGLGLVQATAGTRFLAELGVVLLMFMVGLEFSLPTLWRARRMVAGARSIQVALTAGLIGAGVIAFGIPMDSAVLLGAATAMSSTAITLKLLSEQGELTTRHGRFATRLAGPLASEKPQEEESMLARRSEGLRDHFIVCGGGRIGKVVAQALDAAHLPCLIIESDFARHDEARQLGIRSVFGDASRRRSLEAVGLARAQLIITTFSNVRAL